MPEQSKFTGALAKLKQPAEAGETPAPMGTDGPDQARARGRRPGKRSDPDYEPTTLLLRKRTKKAANRHLEDAETGQDLSDLVELLLAEWNQRQA